MRWPLATSHEGGGNDIIICMIRIVNIGDRLIEKFNARPAFPEEAERAASLALADIRERGDRAVADLVAKFEGAKLRPSQFAVKGETRRSIRRSSRQ